MALLQKPVIVILLLSSLGTIRAAGTTPTASGTKANAEIRRGEAFLAEQHPIQAIAAFQAALEVDPENEAAELGLSSAYRKVFNYGEAQGVLELAIRQHLQSVAPLLKLGELEMESQSYEKALAHFAQAAKLEPSNAAVYLDFAAADQSRGESDRALQDLDQALTLAPNAALGYYLKATIYAELNQNDEALEAAEKALALQPENTRARGLLAKLDVRVGRCAEAAKLLEPLLTSTDVDAEVLYLLARAYECSGKQELASQAMARFSERSTRDHADQQSRMQADFLTIRAGQLARSNQLAPALELLQRALQQDPQNRKAKLQLAKIYYSRGEIDRARTVIEQALEANPFQPDSMYVLALILERQGDLGGALSKLEETIRVDPHESDAYYEMGRIYLKRKENAKAVSTLKKAVEISPNDPDYRRALQEAESSPAQR